MNKVCSIIAAAFLSFKIQTRNNTILFYSPLMLFSCWMIFKGPRMNMMHVACFSNDNAYMLSLNSREYNESVYSSMRVCVCPETLTTIWKKTTTNNLLSYSNPFILPILPALFCQCTLKWPTCPDTFAEGRHLTGTAVANGGQCPGSEACSCPGAPLTSHNPGCRALGYLAVCAISVLFMSRMFGRRSPFKVLNAVVGEGSALGPFVHVKGEEHLFAPAECMAAVQTLQGITVNP